MFTDAGAHFMQSTADLVRLQTVETDEHTHISVITRLRDW